MTHIKPLKKSVKALLENNNSSCSVCIQNIDTSVLSFANLNGALVSWGKKDMCLIVPKQITFQIPYTEIERYEEYPGHKQIGIVLRGRILVSIREAQ
jgi:hypothetical protein